MTCQSSRQQSACSRCGEAVTAWKKGKALVWTGSAKKKIDICVSHKKAHMKKSISVEVYATVSFTLLSDKPFPWHYFVSNIDLRIPAPKPNCATHGVLCHRSGGKV